MEAFVSFNLQIILDIHDSFTKEEHQMFRALVNRRVFATGLLSVVLAYFLTSLILEAKHENIVRNNQVFLFTSENNPHNPTFACSQGAENRQMILLRPF